MAFDEETNPEIRAILKRLEDITDPVEQLVQATRLVDQVRDLLLPELAAFRRRAAVDGRRKLVDSGITATEATRQLAATVGQSPQTIARLIWERREYGYDKKL